MNRGAPGADGIRPRPARNRGTRCAVLTGKEDALARAVAALALLGERIAAVESAITRAAGPGSRHAVRQPPGGI